VVRKGRPDAFLVDVQSTECMNDGIWPTRYPDAEDSGRNQRMSNSSSSNWHRAVDVAFSVLRAVALLPGRYAPPGSRRSRLAETITASLEDPVGELPLSQRLAVSRNVLLVVPPPAEPVSTDLVEAVWAHVDAWLPENACISALVARGSIGQYDADTIGECPHVAALIRAGLKVIVHDDDRCVINIASAVAAPGVPLVVHPLINEADLIICLSRLALRPDSGLRSPSELLARGCTGEATRLCIERLASTVRAGESIGKLEDLALNRLINLVCRRMGKVFAVVEAAGADSTSHAAGNPEDVTRLLAGRHDASMVVNVSQHSGVIIVSHELVSDFASAAVDIILLALQQQPPLLAHAPILMVMPDACDAWTDAATASAFMHGLRWPVTRRPATSSADFVGRRLSDGLGRAASAHPIIVSGRHLPELNDVPGISVFDKLESAMKAFRRAVEQVEDDHADPCGVLLLRDVQYQLPQLGKETFLTGSAQRDSQ